MNISRLVSNSIYIMMTLLVCAISYIYVVNGLKCDPALGICSVAIDAILAYTIYRVVLSIYEEKHITRCSHRKVQKKPCTNAKQQATDDKLIRNENHTIQTDKSKKQRDACKGNHKLAIAECKTYMEKVVSPFFPEETMPDLIQLVDDYANGMVRCTPIMIGTNDTKELRPIDFFHLVWNLWTRLNTLDRRASCRFIKNAFPLILENIGEETIYRKMNDTYARCTIENIPKGEPLVT